MIDEHGNPIGEEYTLALAVEFFLKHCNRRGAVCKNLSTTRAIDDIAAKHGCPVYAAPVGEINVALKMVETNAIIGGEGNGGIMLPDVHIGILHCHFMPLICWVGILSWLLRLPFSILQLRRPRFQY